MRVPVENALLRWLRQPRHDDPWFPGQRAQYRPQLNVILDDALDIIANPRDLIRETQVRAVAAWHEEAAFFIGEDIIGTGSKARSIDHHTITTDRTEDFPAVQSCNRLQIYINAANLLVGYDIITTRQYVRWALLDSGSEVNCISENLAQKLGAVMEPRPEHEPRTELKTADGSPLEYLGRTKIRISWLAGSDAPQRDDWNGEAKIKCYVVPNLQDDVLLSEATICRHKLRDAAASSLNYSPVVPTNTVAPIKLNRRSEKEKKDDEAHLRKIKADALAEEQKKKAERLAFREEMQHKTQGIGD